MDRKHFFTLNTFRKIKQNSSNLTKQMDNNYLLTYLHACRIYDALQNLSLHGLEKLASLVLHSYILQPKKTKILPFLLVFCISLSFFNFQSTIVHLSFPPISFDQSLFFGKDHIRLITKVGRPYFSNWVISDFRCKIWSYRTSWLFRTNYVLRRLS